MAQEDNVVKLPDLLERRAIKIEAALVRKAKNEADWIEAVIELAIELGGARAELNSDQAFGEWFTNRFTCAGKPISHQDRAILVRWGAATPDELRTVLAQEESRSIRQIDTRHPNLGKPARAYSKPVTPPPPKTTIVREEAKEVIRAYRDTHGSYPSVAEAGKVTGKSRIVIEPALAAVIAEDKIAPTTHTFTKAQDKEVEARIKVLESQFNERVRLAMLERNKDYLITLDQLKKEASEKAYHYGQMINNHNPIFTEEEFKTIIICLHPDNSASKEKRDTAFKAVQARKLQLTGKK